VLVRVHEPLSVIDLLDAGSTSHSWNFYDALGTIARADCGVILLLHREETAAELLERAKPPERDAPTPKMALRNYGIGAQILKDLKVRKMRLLALPRRMPSMAGFGLEITGYLQPNETGANGKSSIVDGKP
jgi:3,4-dihydroxy 2-butanone 4-phosphate synthase/GTP cyclohydrolase II